MLDDLIGIMRSGAQSTMTATSLRTAREFFKERLRLLSHDNVRHHPLGFFYASEMISDDAYLRYHLWPTTWQMASLEQGKEDHDHTYTLTSLVMAGRLQNSTFDAIESDRGEFEVLAVKYEGVNSTLSPTGRLVNLIRTSERTYGAGDIYRLEPGTIHRAVPLILPMATLVLTVHHNTVSSPRVFSRVGEVRSTSFHRDKLSESEKRHFLDNLNSL